MKIKESTEKGNHREHREMKPRRAQRRMLTDITKSFCTPCTTVVSKNITAKNKKKILK
jgi:hypothetical protein